jgi:hypothetical protein
MEKHGEVRPGATKDTEQKLVPGVKNASRNDRTKQLDDDFTKRAADKATNSLK